MQVRFGTSVSGKPEPELTWYKDGVIIKPTDNIEINTTSSLCNLIIKAATPEDAGTYKVIAKNDAGQAEAEAELKVEASTSSKPKPKVPSNLPAFTKKLQENYAVEEGGEIELCIEFSGNPKPKVEWEKNGDPIVSIKRVKVTEVENTSKLTIKGFRESDVAEYTVTISNFRGSDVCSTKVEIGKHIFSSWIRLR